MRNYELALVIRTEVNEEALTEFLEKVKGWIAQAGGSLIKTDLWGKRQLAYPIMKQREGLYVFLNAQIPPAATFELERNLRLTEQVLRYLIVRQEA
jgi:small subunit ribosomal protein S6